MDSVIQKDLYIVLYGQDLQIICVRALCRCFGICIGVLYGAYLHHLLTLYCLQWYCSPRN